MSSANARQIGGEHYKVGGEEHWDRVWRLYGRGYFVGQITKYVERYPYKGQIQDLEKAGHFVQKLIELEKAAAAGGVQPGAHYRDNDKDRPSVEMSGKEIDATLGMIECARRLLATEVLSPTGVYTVDGKEFACLKGDATDFTHEGAFGDGRVMWTCRVCREKVYTRGRVLPHAVHECGADIRVQGAE